MRMPQGACFKGSSRRCTLEPDFCIEGTDIDPGALEREVARRAEERRSSGVFGPEMEAMLADRLPGEDEQEPLAPLAQLSYAATRAMADWEVTPAYPVATDKPFLRPLILFVKRLARFWARVAVGPVLRHQSSFNRHTAYALDAVRSEAIAQRNFEIADEEDLALLAGAMATEGEGELLASACAPLIPPGNTILICPGTPGLAAGLCSRGIKPLAVRPQSSPEGGGFALVVDKSPTRFLSGLEPGSAAGIIIPEICFWLRPEKLIRLTRSAALGLKKGGAVIFAVHGFASSGPAPAWCSPGVLEQVLLLAGLGEVRTIPAGKEPGTGSFVTAGFR